MINSIKKKLLNILKNIGYSLWSMAHGRIKGVIDPSKENFIEVIQSTFKENYTYKIFKIKNSRIYTDTITDTAFIVDNKIVEGPSFQHRNPKNAKITENIVFQKGTPKIKKNLGGTVFSLLTGGAGNANYWHWLFDVLPRLKILKSKMNISEIDFFLFPDLKENFQRETLDFLDIPIKKRISSVKFRHIQTKYTIATEHPYVIKNDPSTEIQNLPIWILDFLRDTFLSIESTKKLPTKFYIDRKDSKSNHRHLRKIINEDEVKFFLKKNGFTILSLSQFNFADQINLFKNAENIIGLHGAGFANLTFCKPKTSVLELKPISAGEVIGNLAKKNNLLYQDISIVPSENSNNNQQGFIKIPMNLLEKKIS